MKIVDLDSSNIKPTKERPQMVEGYEWNSVVQNYITQYRGLVSKSDCKKIVDKHKSAEWTEMRHDDTRVCDAVSVDEECDSILFDAFGKMLNLYCADFWRAASSTQDQGYTLSRYRMSDYCPLVHQSKGASLSAGIIINDDCEGGEFQLFGNFKLDATVGTGFIFPSSFMYPFEILPVTEGTRYIATTSFL